MTTTTTHEPIHCERTGAVLFTLSPEGIRLGARRDRPAELAASTPGEAREASGAWGRVCAWWSRLVRRETDV